MASDEATGRQVNGSARKQRFGLTREELADELRALGADSALAQEPLDSELWPTEGLSDRQIELFTKMLKKVRDKD